MTIRFSHRDLVGDGHITLMPSMYSQQDAGTWVYTGVALAVGGFVYYNSSAAQNDKISYLVTLDAGTYRLKTLQRTLANGGIATIQIDNVDVATIDSYSASATENVEKTSAAISISLAGLHTVSLKMATKNAASSGYQFQYQILCLYRTA